MACSTVNAIGSSASHDLSGVQLGGCAQVVLTHSIYAEAEYLRRRISTRCTGPYSAMIRHRGPARGYGHVGTLAWSSGVPRVAAAPTCVRWDLVVRSRCEKCLVGWRCPSSRSGSGGLQFGKQHSCYQHDGLLLEDNRTTRKLDHGGCPDHCGCANHRECPEHRRHDRRFNLPDSGSSQHRARRYLQWADHDAHGGWRDRLRVHEQHRKCGRHHICAPITNRLCRASRPCPGGSCHAEHLGRR